MSGFLSSGSGSMNISKSLFQTDEKVAEDNNSTLKAFINQSKMSTYYQDNPYGTLSFSDKFFVPTMGGPITEQSPGHRPGNIFKGLQVYEYKSGGPVMQPKISTLNVQGIIVPKNMSNFTHL